MRTLMTLQLTIYLYFFTTISNKNTQPFSQIAIAKIFVLSNHTPLATTPPSRHVDLNSREETVYAGSFAAPEFNGYITLRAPIAMNNHGQT